MGVKLRMRPGESGAGGGCVGEGEGEDEGKGEGEGVSEGVNEGGCESEGEVGVEVEGGGGCVASKALDESQLKGWLARHLAAAVSMSRVKASVALGFLTLGSTNSPTMSVAGWLSMNSHTPAGQVHSRFLELHAQITWQ